MGLMAYLRHLLLLLLVGLLCLAGLPQCQAQYEYDDGDNFFANPIGRFDFFRRFISSAGNLFKQATNAVVRFALTSTTGDEICFSILGCLSLKNPWVSSDRPLPVPASPEEIKPNFHLYSRAFQTRYTLTAEPNLSLARAPYSSSKRTFFIVHGYLSSGDSQWMLDLKDALLERVDGNVFIVDWGAGAKDQYLKVAANTRVVGRIIAWFAKILIRDTGAKASDFHFLGHSLGAHICGYAARNITNVARITAFDPAGPTFDGQRSEVRLDKDAAFFVEAIHTNAKPVTSLGFGAMRPLAHVDFYVNGGVDQPGCNDVSTNTKPKSIAEWFSMSMEVVGDLISCSHGRAAEYYIEALRHPECIMWGHRVVLARQYIRWVVGESFEVPERKGKCRLGRCLPMNLDTPYYPARGAFSVTTNPQEPYCIQDRSDDGQDLLTLRSQGYL